MANIKNQRVLTLLAIIGSQIPGSVLWAVTSKATNNGPCTYQWGDVGRAADQAGYNARVWLDHPYAAAAPEQPADLPTTGDSVRISGSYSPPAAAAAAETVPTTVAPIAHGYRGEAVEGMSEQSWQIGQDAIARQGDGNGPQSGGSY